MFKIKTNMSVFILILIFFSFGCIDPLNTVSSTGSGIKLDSFAFNPTSIDDNMKTTVSLVLKNTGTFDAEDVNVIFFGLNDEEWNITDSTGITGVSLDVPVKFTKIRAENKEENIPLQKKKISLILENTKELEKDLIYAYNIVARICYTYQTASTIKVETISEDEFLILNEQNKFRQYPVTSETTDGPFHITVISKQPQIVFTNGQISLKLKIANIGGGTSILENNCADILNPSGNVNTLVSKINKVTFDSADCYLEDTLDPDIYLKKGKSKEIDVLCDVNTKTKKESTLKITIDYDYYFDSNEINVKVRGK